MRILYDYQIFQWQRVGGISNSFINLIQNLPSTAEFQIGIKDSDNVHLKESGLVQVRPFSSEQNFLTNRYFYGKGYLFRWFSTIFPSINSREVNRKYSIDLLKSGQFDVFHPTFFEDYFLPYLNGTPYVFTVHDMITEKFKTGDILQTNNKKTLVDRASHIIAVSNNTKQDLMDIFNVPESKITVIYHGASEIMPSKDFVVGVDKYILFVGQRGGYKNFIPMVKSLLPVLERHQDIKIICTGADFSLQERSLFKENGLQDRVIHKSPSDAELRALYANALCFVFPSLYEGFGIPILEAWKCGCPVILNKKSCFPEIAKDAAVFFTLDNNYSDLDRVMESFLTMPENEKDLLLQRQNKRLQDFSWKKSAEMLLDVYRGVM